jgi:uncharacterized membrane protein YfcA
VVIMGVIGPARRSRKHLAAWSLTIVTLTLLAATLVLAVLNTRRTGVSRLGLDAALSAAVLLYAASGRLIASRRPENAIGWLLASIGLALTTSMVAEQYAVYGLATAPAATPPPNAASNFGGWAT